MFKSAPAVGPKTHDDVVASVKHLVDSLDGMSKAFAADVVSHDAKAVEHQASSAKAAAEKAKVDDMSVKLKAVLPVEEPPKA